MTNPTDRPRITPSPDGGVILHLPDVTHVDTQVWSADVGLTDAGLAALRALLAGQAPATDQTAGLREQIAETLATAEGWTWAHGLQFKDIGTPSAEAYRKLADAVLAVLPAPAGQAEAVLRVVETALGDTLVASAREEALAGIAAVLHAAPVDQATVLRDAYEIAYAEGMRLNAMEAEIGVGPYRGALAVAHLLRKAISNAQQERRMADETQPAPHSCGNCEGIDPDTCFNNPDRPPAQCPAAEFEDYGQQCQKPVGHELHTFEEQSTAGAQPESCAHCGTNVLRMSDPSMDGNHTVWWVHDPGGYTICYPQRAASSPRATPKAAAGVRQDEPRPSAPPCVHCTHPKGDHDGRADHRAKYSPLVAGEPWCHACNAPCDYAAGARQDGTRPASPPA